MKAKIELQHPITNKVLYSKEIEYDVFDPNKTNAQIKEVKQAYLNLTTVVKISEIKS